MRSASDLNGMLMSTQSDPRKDVPGRSTRPDFFLAPGAGAPEGVGTPVGRNSLYVITLAPDLDRATGDLGWTSLTPIQDLAIPHLRAGRDLFAQAQTGTGKTGAFALPILERIEGRAAAPFALVIVPTRELCAQVAAEFQALGRHRSARIVSLYGGGGDRDQEGAPRRRAPRVGATPRRLPALVAPRAGAPPARPEAHSAASEARLRAGA